MVTLDEKITIVIEPFNNKNGIRFRQPIQKNRTEKYIDIKKINLEEYDINNNIIRFIILDIENLDKIKETIKKIKPRNHHKENRIVKIRQIE
jgi:hypothetical protein